MFSIQISTQLQLTEVERADLIKGFFDMPENAFISPTLTAYVKQNTTVQIIDGEKATGDFILIVSDTKENLALACLMMGLVISKDYAKIIYNRLVKQSEAS